MLKKLLLIPIVLLFSFVGKIDAHGKLNWENMIRKCEAKSNPGEPTRWHANTGNDYYFGPQFTYSTWRAYGGPKLIQVVGRVQCAVNLYAVPVPKIVQVAENTYADQGPGAWPNCYRYLYS